MNQQFNDLSANEAIYEAIRQIALHKLVNPKNNVIKNTSRISGYVTKYIQMRMMSCTERLMSRSTMTVLLITRQRMKDYQ